MNPALIPYGTKLYITSTDGKLVYGYAIATDTGASLLNGSCLVDLYYDSFSEGADEQRAGSAECVRDGLRKNHETALGRPATELAAPTYFYSGCLAPNRAEFTRFGAFLAFYPDSYGLAPKSGVF